MTTTMTPRERLVQAIWKIEEACPCAKVTPWAGCAGRDWSDDRETRGREAECKCISTATEAIDCYWPGHAAALELVEAFADHHVDLCYGDLDEAPEGKQQERRAALLHECGMSE